MATTRERKQESGQGRNHYGWRHLTIILSAVVLPGLLTDSASTVRPRVVQAAHR